MKALGAANHPLCKLINAYDMRLYSKMLWFSNGMVGTPLKLSS